MNTFADDLTLLCSDGQSDAAVRHILGVAVVQAAACVGDAGGEEGVTAFVEGFLTSANEGVQALRGELPITIP